MHAKPRRHSQRTCVDRTAGTAQLAAGENDNAVVTLKRLVDAVPNSPVAYLLLASAQAKLQQLDQSRASLEKALVLSPSYGEAQIALVMLEVRAGKYDDASEHCAEGEGAKSRSSLGAVLEGDIYMSKKQFRKPPTLISAPGT